MPDIENNTMSTFTIGGKTFEVKDASARSNIQQINTVLDTKADTSDMSNYYTKSETYSKAEVDNLVESSGGGSGGGTGDGDVKKNLLFDSILDDETKTKVNITINTAGEASEDEVQNIPYTILWGTGSAENPATGKIGLRSSGYLGYGASGKTLCFPVIGGHTYAFIPEEQKTEFDYSDRIVSSMFFAPDFDFTFNKAYKDIPNTSGSIAYDVNLHTTQGTGRLFHSTIKDKIVVPEGMQYLMWDVQDKLSADSEQSDGIRKFKVYDYTTFPIDATYEQIVDNPVTGEDFTITYNLTDATSTNNTLTIPTGSTYTTVINANSNNYISSCSVVIGGTTYLPINGDLIINDANSNITINAVSQSLSNNTYEGIYTVKESLIPDSILNNKLDAPNGINEATSGKLLSTDGQGKIELIDAPYNNPRIDMTWVDVYSEWQSGYFYDDLNNLEYTQISETETMWGNSLRQSISCTPFDNLIEVHEGENWRYKNYRAYMDSRKKYIPSYIIFDSEKNPILSYTMTEGTKSYNYFTIPKNGAYLAVVYYNNQGYSLQKYDVDIVDKNKILQDIKSHYRNYLQTNQIQPNSLDKVYICMGTDDLRSGHTKALHDLYTNNNIPYYMASIPDAMKNCVYDAPYYTNLDYMKMCVDNGGEIVCHDAVPITNDNVDDFDKLYQYFYLNKKELEHYGFKVRGIFKAGGSGVINSRDERIDSWATYLYDYGDQFGYAFPYFKQRRILEYMSGDEDMDNELDNAFANNDYLIFSTHELTETSEARFNHLLSRLSKYTRGVDYEFVTPSQVYDMLVSKQQKEYYTKTEIDNLISNIDGGGQSGGDNSGLSNTAKNLLLTILKATVTNSDQASNIAALETELNSGGSDTPTVINYTITNTLTNCSNSNNASTIQENSSYTATITASSGYTLDSVTVTMGGTDVTSTVYNNGTINISAVTGNIVITASATEDTEPTYKYSGNITNSAGDTVIGEYTIDNNGLLTLKAKEGYENHRLNINDVTWYPWYQYKDEITEAHNIDFSLQWWHKIFDGYTNLENFTSDVPFYSTSRMFNGCTSLITQDFTNLKGGIESNALTNIASTKLVFGSLVTSVGNVSIYAPNCAEIYFNSIPTTIPTNAMSIQNHVDVYVPWQETDTINANNPFGLSNATFHYGYTGE